MAEIAHVNPPGLKRLGQYSNVTTVRGGTLVFVSGQVAMDSEGRVVGKGDIEAQTAQVFENLRTCLATVGATLDDVLEFTVLIRGLTAQSRDAFMRVRSRYISQTTPPASTLIGIDQLVHEDLLVEIKAIAVTGEG